MYFTIILNFLHNGKCVKELLWLYENGLIILYLNTALALFKYQGSVKYTQSYNHSSQSLDKV